MVIIIITLVLVFGQSFENLSTYYNVFYFVTHNYLLEMYQNHDCLVIFFVVLLLSWSMCRLQRNDKLSPERSLNGPDLSSTPLSRQSSLQQELEAQEVCNMYVLHCQ